MDLQGRVEALLGADGALARRLEGWEEREEQTALAQRVAAAFENGGALCAEAGTGVGKSFAYLLPAILWSEATGKQVFVSTRTRALQAQLAQKDLPFLQAVLPIEFTWAVAVGRNNYVCLRRLQRALEARSGLFEGDEQHEQLQRIAEWVRAGPERGVRDELAFVPESKVWQEVQAEQGNCLGPDCKWFGPCHWQRGKRVLRTAKIVIVNHALYFADLALKQQGVEYLPAHDCVVFDEAHHLEQVASEALGLRFGPARCEWQLGRLKNRRGTRGLLVRMGLDREGRLVDEIRRLAESYWEVPAAQLEAHGEHVLRLERSVTFGDAWSPRLEELAAALLRAADASEVEQAFELQARARGIEELALLVRAFAQPASDNEVRWIERERRQVLLRAAPVRVSEHLREALFERHDMATSPEARPTTVLVSATLGPPDDGFAWLRGRLGAESADALRVDSPFPYEQNVELHVAEGLPDPGQDSRAFEHEAAERVAELVLDNDGRALVLCTSWRQVESCREALERALEGSGIELLCQGERPLAQLIDAKRSCPRSVLIGTDSLWEGIDLRGDAVTLVVLTRFPFPVPSHPLTAARIEEIERSGRSSFAEYTLPLAMLKFRQGFGRLVRSSADRGRVVVLDPRARRRRYGQRFLDSLPRCRDP